MPFYGKARQHTSSLCMEDGVAMAMTVFTDTSLTSLKLAC